MRGGEVAWFWSDRTSPPGRQAPTNASQTGLRTRSGVINRLSVDWTGVVPRPQPNGRGHLTGAIGGTAGSASTFGARHGWVNSGPGGAGVSATLAAGGGDRSGGQWHDGAAGGGGGVGGWVA